MMKVGLASFCLAILTLAACTPASTDAAKASTDKPATTPTAPPPYPYFGYGDHSGGGGGDGGGGGY